MPRKMQVKPREVETTKTRKPSQPEKNRTTTERKTSMTRDNFEQFIFEIIFEKNFDKKIVKKKAKIPEMKTVARIIKRQLKENVSRSLPMATAEPVLDFSML